MIAKIVEMLLLFAIIYSSVLSKIEETQPFNYVLDLDFFRSLDGIAQGSIVALIQGIAFVVVYLAINIVSKFFTFKLLISSNTKNKFYNTNFTFLSYDEENNDETIDKERKLNFLIEVKYLNKISKSFFAWLMKDLYLYYELERNDITLRSFNRDVESIEKGIRYPLNTFIEKHILKTEKSEYDVSIVGVLSFNKKLAQENDEVEYIYPRLLNKIGKETLISKYFFKKNLENHQIKVVIKKNNELVGETDVK